MERNNSITYMQIFTNVKDAAWGKIHRNADASKKEEYNNYHYIIWNKISDIVWGNSRANILIYIKNTRAKRND